MIHHEATELKPYIYDSSGGSVSNYLAMGAEGSISTLDWHNPMCKVRYVDDRTFFGVEY